MPLLILICDCYIMKCYYYLLLLLEEYECYWTYFNNFGTYTIAPGLLYRTSWYRPKSFNCLLLNTSTLILILCDTLYVIYIQLTYSYMPSTDIRTFDIQPAIVFIILGTAVVNISSVLCQANQRVCG